MSDAEPRIVPEPGPNEMRDPLVRAELKRAIIWLGLAAAMALNPAGAFAALTETNVLSPDGSLQFHVTFKNGIGYEVSLRNKDIIEPSRLSFSLNGTELTSEVTAGDVRRMAKLGCVGPNQTKTFSRCGMGPCQGRFCGLTVAELLAQSQGCAVPDVGYYRIRPPIKPVTLGELAVAVDALASSPGSDAWGPCQRATQLL